MALDDDDMTSTEDPAGPGAAGTPGGADAGAGDIPGVPEDAGADTGDDDRGILDKAKEKVKDVVGDAGADGGADAGADGGAADRGAGGGADRGAGGPA
jgi:hypothetical protein